MNSIQFNSNSLFDAKNCTKITHNSNKRFRTADFGQEATKEDNVRH